MSDVERRVTLVQVEVRSGTEKPVRAMAALLANVPISRQATPEEWKGQIPKAVMPARLYDELGWGYEMIGSDSDRGKVGALSDLARAGVGQAPEGGAMATVSAAAGWSPMRVIGLGVTTGLLVWLITRALDGRLGRK